LLNDAASVFGSDLGMGQMTNQISNLPSNVKRTDTAPLVLKPFTRLDCVACSSLARTESDRARRHPEDLARRDKRVKQAWREWKQTLNKRTRASIGEPTRRERIAREIKIERSLRVKAAGPIRRIPRTVEGYDSGAGCMDALTTGHVRGATQSERRMS
jgi:hypothetical protein